MRPGDPRRDLLGRASSLARDHFAEARRVAAGRTVESVGVDGYGAMELTRMPWGASSWATLRVGPSTANFDAA